MSSSETIINNAAQAIGGEGGHSHKDRHTGTHNVQHSQAYEFSTLESVVWIYNTFFTMTWELRIILENIQRTVVVRVVVDIFSSNIFSTVFLSGRDY